MGSHALILPSRLEEALPRYVHLQVPVVMCLVKTWGEGDLTDAHKWALCGSTPPDPLMKTLLSLLNPGAFPWVIWRCEDRFPFLNLRQQALLPLWDLGYLTFKHCLHWQICNLQHRPSGLSEPLSPWPHVTVMAWIQSDLYPAWDASNEGDVMRASVSSNTQMSFITIFLISTWYSFICFRGMARAAGTLVKTSAMNNRTPHLGPTNPPRTAKDRQRLANVMFPYQSWL